MDTNAGRDVARDEQLRRVAAAQGMTVAQLVEQLRDVATANQRDASLCAKCEGPMPSDASPTQSYCSGNCRKEASRDRIARRRIAKARVAAGQHHGSCDVCGRKCDVASALCDACAAALDEREQDTATSQPGGVA